MLKKRIGLTPAEIQAAGEVRRLLASQINPTRLKRVLADAERQKQEAARRRAERRKHGEQKPDGEKASGNVVKR